jgi:hypothetical protein
MVEYSVPALFTGNRSKLGEVLIRTDNSGVTKAIDLFLAVRMPSLIAVKDQQGNFGLHESGMSSHSKIYVGRPHDHEW